MTPEEAIEQGAMALFRREIRRHRSRGEHGDGRQPDLFDGTVRRDPCPPHRRHRRVPAGGARAPSPPGLRRVEALTGAAAIDYDERRDALLTAAAATLRTTAGGAAGSAGPACRGASAPRARSRRAQAQALPAAAARRQVDRPSRKVAGVRFAGRVVQDLPPKELKPMADEIKKQLGSGVAALRRGQ